ncbi:hypothetical protein [Clostridium sp. B9]|uniref:hypothetical protein n=1 Tax=Clostridium sp. B9 TaxID=3423224 RepID=UPI003D2EA4FD
MNETLENQVQDFISKKEVSSEEAIELYDKILKEKSSFKLEKIYFNNLKEKIQALKSEEKDRLVNSLEIALDKLVQKELENNISNVKEFVHCFEKNINYFKFFNLLEIENESYKKKIEEVSLYYLSESDKIIEIKYNYLYDFEYIFDDIIHLLIIKIICYRKLILNNKRVEFLKNYIDDINRIKKSISSRYCDIMLEDYATNFDELGLCGNINQLENEFWKCIEKGRGDYKVCNMLSKIYYDISNKYLLENNNYESCLKKALIYANKSIDKKNDDSVLYLNRAILNVKLLNYKEAFKDIELALKGKYIEKSDLYNFDKISKLYYKNNIIYKFLESMSSLGESPKLYRLIGQFILKFVVDENLKKTQDSQGHRLNLGIYDEFKEEAAGWFNKAYNLKPRIRYLNKIVECKLLINKSNEEALKICEEFLKTDEFKNNKENLDRFNYLYAYSLYYNNKFREARDIFYKLCEKLKNKKKVYNEYLRMYFNCLFKLKEYNVLLEHYKIESPFNEETTKNNIKVLEKIKDNKFGSIYAESIYEINNKEVKKIDKNEGVKKYYTYKDNKYDKEYESLYVEYECFDLSNRNKEAEKPDWLGGQETEEEYWEHTE